VQFTTDGHKVYLSAQRAVHVQTCLRQRAQADQRFQGVQLQFSCTLIFNTEKIALGTYMNPPITVVAGGIRPYSWTC
jgi:hypothetical protein